MILMDNDSNFFCNLLTCVEFIIKNNKNHIENWGQISIYIMSLVFEDEGAASLSTWKVGE